MAQLHFLIVEDEYWDTERICKALSGRYDNPALTCVSTAAAALRIKDANQFTAIFVNLKLNGNSVAGFDVIEHLRKQSKDVPIFVVTGAGSEEAKFEAYKAKATGFFEKDFTGLDGMQVAQTIDERIAAIEKGKTMKHKGTTIGATISNIGTGIIGLGVVPSLTSMAAAEDLKWLIIAGYVIQIIGNQIAGMNSADAKVVNEHLNK
jgi:ActR/RegA family two-component response regulator